jgi:gliding motility-associated-like protein
LLLAFIGIGYSSNAQCPGVTPSFTADQSFFCGLGPHLVTFTNTTTGATAGPPQGFEWFIDGVSFDNTNNVGQTTSTTITNAGSYEIMMVYTDPSGPGSCSDTAYLTLDVVPSPSAGFIFGPNNQCAFQDVNFTNTSTGTFAGTTYTWNFNPGTSNQENPSQSFNGSGTYNVSLTVNNGPGCTSTDTQPVTIIDAPNPFITGDDGDGDLIYCLFPGDVTTSETVTFSNFTTGGDTYEWDFGDGSPVFTTNSLADITHTYNQYGTFDVTMTATNSTNGCQTSMTIQVVFEKFVSAALTLDLTEYSGCAPHTLATLVNLSANASTYVWDFGDGTTYTLNDSIPPVHTYTTNGTYTITLTASNSCNTAIATISPIIIIDGPTASFNPSITNGCAPQNVSFTNTSVDAQPANNFQWDMGNGNTYTNVINPPVQTYPTTGTYTVELIAGNGCGYDTISTNIFIDTIPTVDLVLNPINGCAPLTVDPTATLLSGINVNWQWYVDGAYYSNAPNDIADQTFGSLNPNDSTLHTIQVNVWNNCGNDSEVEQVYVYPPTIAAFTAPDTLCLGDIATFTNASTGVELTYSWDFGDGTPVDNSVNPTHTYAAAGDYTVTLTVNGICGPDVISYVVTIVDIPVIDITPNPAAICAGGTVTFTNNSSTNGTYFWNFGPNGAPTTSTLFDPGAVTFSGTGQQLITFTINYAGCVATDTAYVDVSPFPIPAFTVVPNDGCTPLDVTITNNTVDQPGTTYDWDYGNGTTSNGYTPTNQTYTSGAVDATYTINLVVQNGGGCIDSLQQTVTVHPLPIATFTILDDTVCLGEPMLFANNSTGATSYLWDFGDGATSTAISPSHAFIGVGDFTVSLVAYTSFGCTDTTTTDIFIDSIPTAAFTNTTECFGGTTIFTNNSFGSPVSFEWDFGDGSPVDNTFEPTHTYGAPGSYLVTLTVTNSVNCSNSLPQIVNVNQVPVADFTWSQTCEGQAMNFTDQTLNNPIGWAWDFGDGNSSLIQNPSHIYLDTGSYTVQLVVSGGTGCLDSITYDVYVDSIPTADFTFVNACTNEDLVFTDNSSINPNTYLWQFGDGNTSNLVNPTHSYTAAGTYPVTLTVEYASNGCSHTITQNVESHPRTVPAFTANTPCLGEQTDFIDQTTNTPNAWEWDFGDGSPVEFVQNPSHLYAVDGFYDITLITQNAFGCSDTLIQQIQIFGLPTADFTSTTVCEGAITQFTDNSIDDVSWQWDFGDGVTDLNENPTHVYVGFGTYTVQLVVLNAVGCSDTIDYNVTVNPNPTAGFYADTACFGYLTSFVDTSIDAVSWEYNFGDLTQSLNSNPTHTYPADGIYTAQQIVTNVFGCMDSTEVDILIHPQPQAGFDNNTVCALDVVQFNDTTIGNINYWEWDFGDGSVVDYTQNPVHIYATGGLYDVTLISGNPSGCLDTTTVSVEVYTNPVANFEADTVCYLDITTFTDFSTDVVPIASWDYDFGDNINQSNLQNPTYIYQAPGIYPATLTVTNIHGCDSTITVDVIVNNIPIAEFDYDTVCWGSPTTFTDISTGSVNSWNWDFGDGVGTSTTGPVTTYTYPNPGQYIASMEVDGGAGCTDIMYHIVTVIDVLTPAISAPDTVCLNETFQFLDQSTVTNGTITSWSWDFGDGNTSNLQDPFHAYSASGTYNVTLDVTTSTGCTNTGAYVATVMDLPISDFDFTIPCEGQPTIFTDLSNDPNGTIIYWEWDFGDGSPVDNSQNPQHQYAVAGNYDVTLVVASEYGCYDTIQQTVTIYPSPTADFTFGLECGGVPVDLVDQSIGNIVDYEWIFNGNTISTAQDTAYVFPTDTDTHPVTLVVTTNLGCVDSITQNVVTRPVVNFDFGPFETAGCPVMEVAFFENSTVTSGGTIVNWLWDMGDGSYSFSPSPIHYYEDEGQYQVSLQVITDEDCVYSDTLMYSIIVYPQPQAGFTYAPIDINILDPEVTFTNTSQGAQDVEWYFGDFDYSNEWHPIHTYEDTGYFEVSQTVYNEFGCSDTVYQTLYVSGVFVAYAPNSFTPNGDGINDVFNVSGYGITSYELLIFNRWGEKIKTITSPSDGWDGTYRGEECQDGVYTWKLRAIDFEEIPHEMVGHVSLIR